jgi:uncharacterized protein YuzE
MAGIDVSYDANGDSLIVWFDRPQKTHHSEETGGVILKKDERGLVIGIEHPTYFASSRSGMMGDYATP